MSKMHPNAVSALRYIYPLFPISISQIWKNFPIPRHVFSLKMEIIFFKKANIHQVFSAFTRVKSNSREMARKVENI
jgi:hypothetical protein